MPAFNESSALLFRTAVESGITSPQELANLMGNASVETGGFRRMHESFAYHSADAVIGAVSSADDRFSRAQVEAAVASRDPQLVAKVMYENRADLGNTQPGDGWRFHGRGYLQYTGRENYERYGEKFGVDLAGKPDLAADPLGEAGMQELLAQTINATKAMDSTVQEKAVAHPTDSRLLEVARRKLVMLCKRHGLKRRQSYEREEPGVEPSGRPLRPCQAVQADAANPAPAAHGAGPGEPGPRAQARSGSRLALR